MTKEKKNKKKIISKHKETLKNKQNIVPQSPISHFFVKLGVLVLIIFGLLIYSDNKGFFNPDLRNDHTMKKWNAFYDFTKRNNVDILLLGNSHLYTGINPKNLSVTLGVNSFILASPGTSIADSYWSLKEALKKCTPSIVVLETYGISDFNPYKLKKGGLSDQFKSFFARKNIFTKIQSTPYLFSVNNYPYAWSNTLRNHNFIFNNTEQLERNKKIIRQQAKNKYHKRKNNLYLGRYIRFQKGIQNSVLKKYLTEGAPVDGGSYTYNEYAESYIDKITKLCKQNNIELIFLTLPMYEKHIKEYDKWNQKLSQLLRQYPNKWLNMQEQSKYNSIGFGMFAFENTYKKNQHMTYSGSLLATYNLASFIRDSLQIPLPKRAAKTRWHNIVYGVEGYFENHSPRKNDTKNKIICQNKIIKNTQLKEVLLIKNKNNTNTIIAKISKNKLAHNYKQQKVQLIAKYIQNNQEKSTLLELEFDAFHTPEKFAIYSQALNPVEIIDISDGTIK